MTKNKALFRFILITSLSVLCGFAYTKELKGNNEFGSSLIIMSIVAGAVLPRVFGYMSDVTGNIQYGYVVPSHCFVVVAFLGFKGYRVKVKPEKLPVAAIL